MESTKPSATELTLMKALWRESPLSAREVHERVAPELQWSFSSTRKTLDRMLDKALIRAGEVHGIKVFSAAQSKVQTLAALAMDFSRTVLEVKGPLPVAMFADSALLSPDEIEDLERLLEANDHD